MFVVLSLIAINIYILTHTGTGQSKPKPIGKNEKVEWTVYGTMWCGWTKKQLEYLKNKDIPHKFIDCEKGKCDGIDAFPVMRSSSGEEIKGYKEI
tara:strand:+ start:3415 stop:3699 length:285 start_codon:yes stop_codon:yes gene_type:complete